MSIPLGPCLVNPNPDPDIFPAIVVVPCPKVTVLFPPRIIFPVPMLSPLFVLKAKSPFQFWALFVERVKADPVVESMVPPVMVSAPVPMAEALLRIIVPEDRVVPPE